MQEVVAGKLDPEKLEKYKIKPEPFDYMPTLAEFTLFFLDEIKSRISKNTYTNYRSIALTHILPKIGAYLLCNLNSAMFLCYFDEKAINGRVDGTGPLAPKTLREHYNVANGILKRAMKADLIQKNPILVVELPKPKKKEIHTLSDEECNKINEHIDPEFKENSSLPVMVACEAGLRAGEVCALTLEDIDLDNRMIHVNKSLNRVVVEKDDKISYELCYGTTKSKEERLVPMTKLLYESLKKYTETMPWELKQHKEHPLFINSRGNVVEPRLLNYHFNKFCEELGIEDTHFHSLRHTFATRAIEAEIEMNTLSNMLGHASTTITQNVYVHITSKMMHKEIAKLDQLAM